MGINLVLADMGGGDGDDDILDDDLGYRLFFSRLSWLTLVTMLAERFIHCLVDSAAVILRG